MDEISSNFTCHHLIGLTNMNTSYTEMTNVVIPWREDMLKDQNKVLKTKCLEMDFVIRSSERSKHMSVILIAEQNIIFGIIIRQRMI